MVGAGGGATLGRLTTTPSTGVAEALRAFRRALEGRCGPRLREVRLFGSHARGDAHQDSDVDLLVVVDDLSETERRELLDLACRVEQQDPEGMVVLSPLAYSTERVAVLRARERLLFRDIEREGIVL